MVWSDSPKRRIEVDKAMALEWVSGDEASRELKRGSSMDWLLREDVDVIGYHCHQRMAGH